MMSKSLEWVTITSYGNRKNCADFLQLFTAQNDLADFFAHLYVFQFKYSNYGQPWFISSGAFGIHISNYISKHIVFKIYISNHTFNLNHV